MRGGWGLDALGKFFRRRRRRRRRPPGVGGGGGKWGSLRGRSPLKILRGGLGGGEAPPNTLPGFGVRPGFGARPGLPMNISEIAHEYIRDCFPRNQITKMRLKRIFVI